MKFKPWQGCYLFYEKTGRLQAPFWNCLGGNSINGTQNIKISTLKQVNLIWKYKIKAEILKLRILLNIFKVTVAFRWRKTITIQIILHAILWMQYILYWLYVHFGKSLRMERYTNNTIKCKKLETIVSGRKNVARPFLRRKQVSTNAEM